METGAPLDEHSGSGRATATLYVCLLGELDLRLGDAPFGPVESARARSLLGYLLLHNEVPHPRERLAFLLWPDSTEAQARTNLRNLLHTLRRAIPEVEQILEVTSRTVRRRRDARCWVDVAAFSAALDEADTAETGSEAMVRALRRAVQLYGGDLLEGCYDEWVIEARERVRDRYIAALRSLAGVLADRGEHADAVRLGRELLRCAPLQEDAYRLLMAIHGAAGDRAAAVRVYHECVSTLERELGIEPAPATQAAYAALVQPVESSAAAGERLRTISAAPLVGRDREWAQLTRCWLDVEAGRSQFALVSGEPGVGKTRLVEELRAWCAHRGALVADARAYPTEGELGYGVVISWLRSGELAAGIRRAGSTDLAEIARLLPELAPTREPSPVAVEDAEQRRRVFDALARALTASARPTLLVADDAQWCDEPTMQLIHYLVRSEPSSPVLVVATARREELDDQHPLAALVSGLLIVDRTTEIGLGRLSRADTGALASTLLDRDLTTVDVDALYADTEGNPLFVVETIRAGWSAAGRQLSEMSPKLLAVISSRLRQLSEPAREALGVAATVGRAFTAELLGAAAELEEKELVLALDELWRRGVIREHDIDAYDFSHGKIRDAVYDALGPAARRRNHLAVAAALERVHERELDPVSGQVAFHLDRGGRVDDAISWYQRAAVETQRRYANAEAVRLLQRARELVSSLPAEERLARELDIVSSLPTPLIAIDAFNSDRLAEAQQRAVEVATILGVELEPPLLRSLVLSSLCRDEFDGAREAAQRLHASAERTGDEGLAIEAEYLLGISTFWAGALQEAREHFELVVDRFVPEGRAEHVLRFGHDPQLVCLSRLANTLWFLGDADAARQARDDAVASVEQVAHPYTHGVVLNFAIWLALDLDEQDRFRELTAAYGDMRDQAPQFAINAEAFAGFVALLDGDGDGGMARIRWALGACGPVNVAPGFRAALQRLLVAAHDVLGDAGGGRVAVDEALTAGGTRLWEAEIRRLHAVFLHALGAEPVEVDHELTCALDVARHQGALGHLRRIEHTRTALLTG